MPIGGVTPRLPTHSRYRARSTTRIDLLSMPGQAGNVGRQLRSSSRAIQSTVRTMNCRNADGIDDSWGYGWLCGATGLGEVEDADEMGPQAAEGARWSLSKNGNRLLASRSRLANPG
jgi:hypothetical protein